MVHEEDATHIGADGTSSAQGLLHDPGRVRWWLATTGARDTHEMVEGLSEPRTRRRQIPDRRRPPVLALPASEWDESSVRFARNGPAAAGPQPPRRRIRSARTPSGGLRRTQGHPSPSRGPWPRSHEGAEFHPDHVFRQGQPHRRTFTPGDCQEVRLIE